jgi:signal transduction histidine kinase/HAMP domain-containing protein
MRGGLGRTLLTAFLVLSIAPLSVISFIAATQARTNLQREVGEKLETVAVLTESQLERWLTGQGQIVSVLANGMEAGPAELIQQASRARSTDKAILAWLVIDENGRILASDHPLSQDLRISGPSEGATLLEEDPLLGELATTIGRQLPSAIVLREIIPTTGTSLAAVVNPDALADLLDTAFSWSEDVEVYLVAPSGQAIHANHAAATRDLPINAGQGASHTSSAIEAALDGRAGEGTYESAAGEPVIGAYRWLADLGMALIVEQAQSSAFAASDSLAVLLIGATLAAVLLTALIASGVTRRITLPIIAMTATAVQIASGDLNQKVPASRRDEIGILARSFNVMTTKLRLLYEDLEQKVQERTKQLQDANAEVRYQAMLLAISAEVGRVVTSILERERLLEQVVELIRDCFQAYFVAIYFLDNDGERVNLTEATGALGAELKAKDYALDVDDDPLVSTAIRHLKPQTMAGPALSHRIDRDLFPHTRAELAIPLKIGDRAIGVLDVHSTLKDAFEGNEIMVLETLSGQVVVAIENARAYQMEHRAVERLQELDELRRRFLSNMSRELRMPLNNIIGFSRVILKGIDGPINDVQRDDLTAIHDSGQQLLALINDILDIAQIEAGAMELSIQPADYGEIARSVIPTSNALLEGRPVQFRCDISPDLPVIMADSLRLRQVLVKLVSNAAKFTSEGEIVLSVWCDDGEIITTITDTGIGIPEQDRDKVFELFRQGSRAGSSENSGTGLGLTFSKEIVEMHGGTIWLESQEGLGTAFTIILPAAETEKVTE